MDSSGNKLLYYRHLALPLLGLQPAPRSLGDPEEAEGRLTQYMEEHRRATIRKILPALQLLLED